MRLLLHHRIWFLHHSSAHHDCLLFMRTSPWHLLKHRWWHRGCAELGVEEHGCRVLLRAGVERLMLLLLMLLEGQHARVVWGG